MLQINEPLFSFDNLYVTKYFVFFAIERYYFLFVLLFFFVDYIQFFLLLLQ